MKFDSTVDTEEVDPHKFKRRDTKMVFPSERILLQESLVVDMEKERKREEKLKKKKKKSREKRVNKEKEFRFSEAVEIKKTKKNKMQTYKAEVKWWQKASMSYSMYPVRETMEKLMGSNTVTILDRMYMDKLKTRILEWFAEMIQRRIQEREGQEYQRGKHLVLTGKIPFEEAPEAMAEHIVIVLENFCNELIEKRRAMLQLKKPKIPNYLYWDDTPDPPFRLSIEIGHKFRTKEDILCKLVDNYLLTTEDEDIQNGLMFEEHEYKRLKHLDLLVRRLMLKTDILEVYDFTDEIMKKDTPEVTAEKLKQARRDAGFPSNIDMVKPQVDEDDLDNEEEEEEEDNNEENDDEDAKSKKYSKRRSSVYQSIAEEDDEK